MLQRAHALADGIAAPMPVLAAPAERWRGSARSPPAAGADALTGIERRVATLAAEGRANRDIAQALFLTPRDVERHARRRGGQARLGLAPGARGRARGLMGASRIELCGPLAVEIDGEERAGELRGRQGRMLLAYLVLNRHRAVRRDELAEVLWAESGPPRAARRCWRRRSRGCGARSATGRLEGRGELRLVLRDGARVDWEVAHDGARPRARGAAAGDAAGALEARREARGDRGWRAAARARGAVDRRAARELGDLRLEALELRATAGIRLGGGELPEAERAARRAVELAPFRESARAALMEVLARAGQRRRGAAGVRGRARAAARGARHLARTGAGRAARAAAAAPRSRGRRRAAAGRRAAPRRAGLVERDRELAELGAARRRGAGRRGAHGLIEGPAGLGKTRLLAERGRLAEAGARGCSPPARPTSSATTRSASCASCSRACCSTRAAASARWRARPPRARAVFESPERPGEGQSGSFAALHGLYWLALNLAGERPLAARASTTSTGADSPSLRFLAYLARRLEGLPVLLAATLRTGEPGTDLALMAEIAEDAATTSCARAAERGRGRRGGPRAARRRAPTRRSAPRATRRPAATRCCCASC